MHSGRHPNRCIPSSARLHVIPRQGLDSLGACSSAACCLLLPCRARVGAMPPSCKMLLKAFCMCSKAGLGSKFSAGVVLGALSGLLATPFDLVRIRVQAEAGLKSDSGILLTGLRAGEQQRISGTLSGFQVVLQDGLRGIFRGSGVNVASWNTLDLIHFNSF